MSRMVAAAPEPRWFSAGRLGTFGLVDRGSMRPDSQEIDVGRIPVTEGAMNTEFTTLDQGAGQSSVQPHPAGRSTSPAHFEEA